MSAARKLEPLPPPQVSPSTGSEKRHLELVPPPRTTEAEEARRLRETRWLSALLALATVVLFSLWTAALLGAADAAWWPAVFGAAFAAVVAFAFVVIRKTRQ